LAGPPAGMTMILVDGVPAEFIPADDRGFAYGDGVFRTLAMRRSIAELWTQHCAKLAADCRALDLVPPTDAELRRDMQHIAAQMPDCALRITVTRGSGGRGYALPRDVRPRRVVAASPLPVYRSHYWEQGIRARICTLRLAAQPKLAGIKHLNRLENVLARAEWTDPEIVEGLLLDMDGHVVEGTRCNLFLVEDGGLVTPDLSRCGVSGVTRDLVIDAAGRHGIPCRIESVSVARLTAADEVFLVNSLIGAWPVALLEQRAWSAFAMTARVRKWFDALRDPAD
jgi:4-amino-4-deoxychorismate lyase